MATRTIRNRLKRFAIVVVVLVLACSVLHLSIVQDRVKQIIVAQAESRIDGSFDVGRLDYRLWLGHVTLEDVDVALDDDLLSRLHVDRLRFRYRPLAGLAVEARRPVVDLANVAGDRSQAAANDSGSDSRTTVTLPSWLEEIEVVDGSVTYADQSAEVEARLFPVQLSLKPATGGIAPVRTVSFRAEGGSASWGSRAVDVSRIDVRARLSADSVTIDSARVDSSTGSVTAEGAITELSPFTADLELGYDLVVDPLLPAEGTVVGEARLDAGAAGIWVEGHAEISGLRRDEVGPYTGNARFEWSSEVLLATAALRGDELAFDGSAELDFANESQHLDVIAESSSLVAVLEAMDAPVSPWDSSVRARASLAMTHWNPQTFDGEARLTFDEGGSGDLAGTVTIDAADGTFTARARSLSFPGGRLELTAGLRELEALTASFSIDVAEISPTLEAWLPQASHWVEGGIELAGNVEGEIGGALRASARLADSGLRIRDEPYSVSSEVVYDHAGLHLPELIVRSEDGGRLRASGSVGLESRELTVDGRFDRLTLGPFARMAAIPATAAATGRFGLTGSLDRPRPEVDIELSSISYEDTPLPPIRLELKTTNPIRASDGAPVEIRATLVESRDRFLGGTLEITPPYELDAEVELSSLPWPAITALVPSFPEDAGLDASGHLAVSMPLSAPSHLRIEAELARVSATIAGREFETSPFRLRGDLQAVDISRLVLLHGDEEVVSVEGTLPLSPAAEGNLSLEADVALEVFEDWIPGDEITGRARADIELTGGLHPSNVRGSLDIDNGSYVHGGARVDAVNLRASLNGDTIRLESLQADVLGGSLVADGVVPLPFPASAPRTDARIIFDVTGIDAGALNLDNPRLPEAVTTSISLAGEVDFPRGDFSRWRATGELQEMFVATEGAVVSLDAKASWRYGPEGFHTETIRLVGGETDLRISVEAFGGEGDTPVLVTADGPVDLVLANVALPDTWFVSGVTRLDEVRARLDDEWQLAGSARLTGVELVVETPPIVVTDVTARLTLNGKTITVDELRGKPGGGTLTGRGEIALFFLSPASERDDGIAANFDLEVDGVRLEYPEGLRSRLAANVQIRDDDDGYRLEGEIIVNEAIYDRRFAIKDTLVGALRRDALDIAQERGALERVHLRISVRSERDIVVDNNLGRIQASSDLIVTGTAADPELNGTIRALPGGTLTFGANAYEIETARATLTSFPVLPPEVDVRARTKAGGHDLVLEIHGRLDNLQTTLQSPTDPSLSRADVASLLLTGRTVEDVRGDEGEVLGEQAALYLGGSLASTTEEGLSRALPLSSVRLEPTLVGEETDPAVRFSLGQAMTEELFLTYSIGLNDAEKQLWIVDYELPYELSLRGVRRDGNEYTGGVTQDLFFDFYDRERPKSLPDERRKPEVLDVRLEGEIPLKPEDAREAIDLERGDDYEYWDARGDAENLVERLRNDGYLNARVHVTTRPQEHGSYDIARGTDSDPEPVEVVFEVETGPRVEIVWLGDPVDDELAGWAHDQFRGYLPPRAQAARLRRALTYRLMSDGYFDAIVETAAFVDESNHTARIEIDVALGPRGQDVIVDFRGNERLEDDMLRRVLPEARTSEFFDRIVGHPEELREELELLYASRGFLDARVSAIAVERGPAQEQLAVTIDIDEGEPFQVSATALEGASSIEESRLRELLELGPGERFLLDTYLGDRRRLESLYRREGFPDVSVRGHLQLADGNVAVRFEVHEGSRAHVREIVVEGARATNESVIDKAVTLEPGNPLRLSDLTETQSRLYDLQIFRSVNVSTMAADDGQGDETVLIEVTEPPDLRLGYGIRYTTHDQFELTGDVHLPNVLGGGRQLTLSSFFSGSREIYRLNLATPYFFGVDLDTSVFVQREVEEAETFNANSWTLTFQQRHPLRDHLSVQWGASYNHGTVRERASSGPLAFDVHAARTELNLSFISDTRNSLTRPSRGRFWTVSAEYAPGFLGSDFHFVKLFGQVFFYRPVTSNIVWASSYRAGIATGFDQVLLPDTRFRAGGPNSVRGFPVNELGDPDPILGVPSGGEGIIVMNQELRFPIFWRFGGVTFYDVGNVYLEASDFDPTDLRHSVGVGLSVELPVGLLTIDWARLLNPPESLDKSRFHISFGHAF